MTEGLRERADMQKFVSQSTVAMIHNRPAGQRAGERRTLTLLFSDIRGFTQFAEGCSPEEAVRVLNRYLHLQADLVKRFHGDVDKFIGDAVFAHFSGPDMALDAIRCAVEIQRAVEARQPRRSRPARARGRDRHRDGRGHHRQHRKRRPARLHGDRAGSESQLPAVRRGRAAGDPDERADLRDGAGTGRAQNRSRRWRSKGSRTPVQRLQDGRILKKAQGFADHLSV